MYKPDTRILVVDDMLTMRKIVCKSLKELGFSQFTEAKDGGEAWETLQKLAGPETGINVIVSDWNMPNTTGLEFLKLVRADARFKAIPFLMVTAEAEKSQIVEAVKSGVSNYIVKPFTPGTLKEKLEAMSLKVPALTY